MLKLEDIILTNVNNKYSNGMISMNASQLALDHLSLKGVSINHDHLNLFTWLSTNPLTVVLLLQKNFPKKEMVT